MRADFTEKFWPITERISKAYSDGGQGCIDFYNSFTPDKWQGACDFLERAMIQGDPQVFHAQLIHYENTCLRLIKEYKAMDFKRRSRNG